MTMVKNMAILAVNEVFIIVNIIPDATPLSCGGTEFIILELFGDPNIPLPTPIINKMDPNSRYVKLYGSNTNNMNANALNNIPPVAIHLGPYLSDNAPDVGPIIIIPMVNGII